MEKPGPDFSFEEAALALGATVVVGVDEVGRGPLAGPVTAAAVRLLPGQIPEGLNDSKKLTARRREALYHQIMARAEVSVAHASVTEIEVLNILRASHLAMERALQGLPVPADFALIDGNVLPKGMPFHLGGLDCGQSDTRQADGGIGATISRVWLGQERRLPDKNAPCGPSKSWGDPAS